MGPDVAFVQVSLVHHPLVPPGPGAHNAREEVLKQHRAIEDPERDIVHTALEGDRESCEGGGGRAGAGGRAGGGGGAHHGHEVPVAGEPCCADARPRRRVAKAVGAGHSEGKLPAVAGQGGGGGRGVGGHRR